MATVMEITSEDQFRHYASSFSSSSLLVVYFHAPWAEPCKQMSTVLKTLASTYPADNSVGFLSLDAEELADIAEHYEVTAVPYIVLQKGGRTVETISGGDPAKVRRLVEKHAGQSGANGKFDLPPPQTVSKPAENGAVNDLGSYTPTDLDPKTKPEYSSGEKQTKEELFNRLDELVKAAPVMLFMKGTPSAPQCGFSRQTVNLLRGRGVRYGFFNILADDDVRQGLKEYADWPTFPQLWVNGELVGGLDIVSLNLICFCDSANQSRRFAKSSRTTPISSWSIQSTQSKHKRLEWNHRSPETSQVKSSILHKWDTPIFMKQIRLQICESHRRVQGVEEHVIAISGPVDIRKGLMPPKYHR
jgi:Grx4 family monothiol glutaredoxin